MDNYKIHKKEFSMAAFHGEAIHPLLPDLITILKVFFLRKSERKIFEAR